MALMLPLMAGCWSFYISRGKISRMSIRSHVDTSQSISKSYSDMLYPISSLRGSTCYV